MLKKQRKMAGAGFVLSFSIAIGQFLNPINGQAEAILLQNNGHMKQLLTSADDQGNFAGVFQATVSKMEQGEYVFVEYPVLTGIDGYDQSVVDSINGYFYGDAAAIVSEQAEEYENLREIYMSENPDLINALAYEITCESMFIDGNIYSVMQYCYTYTGGAHGYSYPFGTSFDLETGEKMTMGELLNCDEATAQEAVVEAYRKDIIGQVENITEESIRGAFDIMDYWMMEDGMYVNIAPYGVASYAAGQQTAIVTPEILTSVQGRMGNAGAGNSASGNSSSGENGAAEGESGEAAGNGTSADEMITVINGIQAPASDFILPQSSERALTDADLTVLEGSSVEEEHYKSQLAINEILARYGYQFYAEQGGAAKEAYDQFEGKGWYEQAKAYCPSTSANEMLYTYITSLELSNIDLICQWQQEHNCYY